MLSYKQRKLEKEWETNIQVLKLLKKVRMCYTFTHNKDTRVKDAMW